MFCYKDFYLKEEKTYWMKLCKIFLRRGQAVQARVSSPPGGKLPRPRYLTPTPSCLEKNG